MKFLDNILGEITEYKQLFSSVVSGKLPAMATGLGGAHKAHLIHSICKNTKKNN